MSSSLQQENTIKSAAKSTKSTNDENRKSISPVDEKENTYKSTGRPKKRTGLYTENLPTFYVGNGNNSELIIDIMKRMGWEQIFESNDDSYKFKWVQCGRSINWNSFREGEQIVNHVPNCSLFTNKLNLLCSLQAFEKLQMQSANKIPNFLPLEEYVPLTYKLDDRVDKETFFATAKSMLFILFVDHFFIEEFKHLNIKLKMMNYGFANQYLSIREKAFI
jgi:hypothetical protein